MSCYGSLSFFVGFLLCFPSPSSSYRSLPFPTFSSPSFPFYPSFVLLHRPLYFYLPLFLASVQCNDSLSFVFFLLFFVFLFFHPSSLLCFSSPPFPPLISRLSYSILFFASIFLTFGPLLYSFLHCSALVLSYSVFPPLFPSSPLFILFPLFSPHPPFLSCLSISHSLSFEPKCSPHKRSLPIFFPIPL